MSKMEKGRNPDAQSRSHGYEHSSVRAGGGGEGGKGGGSTRKRGGEVEWEVYKKNVMARFNINNSIARDCTPFLSGPAMISTDGEKN